MSLTTGRFSRGCVLLLVVSNVSLEGAPRGLRGHQRCCSQPVKFRSSRSIWREERAVGVLGIKPFAHNRLLGPASGNWARAAGRKTHNRGFAPGSRRPRCVLPAAMAFLCALGPGRQMQVEITSFLKSNDTHLKQWKQRYAELHRSLHAAPSAKLAPNGYPALN